MRYIRILLASAFAVLLGAGGVALTPSTAHADDIYRYWAYFVEENGVFVPAPVGPADNVPKDGDIEGYRWAAPADFTNPNVPRADDISFQDVCGGVDADSDEKRVAVLIDYGVEQDAPDGADVPKPQALCSVVGTTASSLETLENVADKVRTENGSYGPLLCGIDDYPPTGCADEIAESGTPADEPVEFVIADSDAASSSDSSSASDSDDDGVNVPLLVGAVVVVVAIAAGGVYLSRRRQSS